MVAIDVDQRWRAEGIVEHARQLRHQPVVAVVVVENEDAVIAEMVTNTREGLLREQERFEPE